MKNIKDFNEYIKDLVADYDADHYGDHNTYAHWCADGSEYVIYYHNAWYLVDLVSGDNPELFFDAEEMAFDVDNGSHTSLNGVMTSVAYFIIYVAILSEFSKRQEA